MSADPGDASATPRLPRAVEADARHAAVARVLTGDVRPLWTGGRLAVPHVAWTDELAAALRTLRLRGQLTLGLEAATSTLASEAAGLTALAQRGATQGERVSRVLLLAGEGAERFYRGAERLVGSHTPRVLALRVDVSPETLGGTVLGPDRSVKAALVAHRDAVATLLLALAGDA